MALYTSAPRSLCVLRLSAIGDVCNTIAVVQAIQTCWPNTEITWITGKLEAKLLKSVSGINVIEFDKSAGWRSYIKLWKELNGHQFDALLHMQYAFRASIATIGIKAKHKLGFDSDRSQDLQQLFTNVKVPSPQEKHVLNGLMAFNEVLGVPKTVPCWQLSYSENDEIWAKQRLNAERNLVVVPAASKGYKNWTASGYSAVIRHAVNAGWNIVLAGSAAAIELELGEQIEALSSCKLTNLIGKSNLQQMLALLDLADLVIAPDTGPIHMANAMGTPVIGLYAHHNPQRTGPYRYQEYVVSVYEEAIFAETGKHSNELSWRARVKDQQAMHRIQANQVINMFDKVVELEQLGSD